MLITETLQQAFNQLKTIIEFPSNQLDICVAYSGGIDSSVLLHALASQAKTFNISVQAIHINHGLNPNANSWAEHCQQFCLEQAITCQVFTVDTQPASGESVEAWAREQRYRLLKRAVSENTVLVTAHHQEDQAETVLLQLCRGAGVAGLAAMPVVQSFSTGYLWRPLLNLNKSALEAYATAENITWIDDDSNQDTSFDRNFMRHQILPQLQSRWPSVTRTLARVSENCADAQTVIDACTQQDLQQVQTEQAHVLSLTQLQTLTEQRQAQVIRYWLNHLQQPLPTRQQLQHVLTDIVQSRPDAMPCVKWADISLRRYRDHLFLQTQLAKIDKNYQAAWSLEQPLILPADVGVLHYDTQIGQGLSLELLQQADITVRFRQGGERLRMSESQGSQALKKRLQEWGIPPWLRDRVPLLYANGEIVAVIGYHFTKYFEAKPNELGAVFYLS